VLGLVNFAEAAAWLEGNDATTTDATKIVSVKKLTQKFYRKQATDGQLYCWPCGQVRNTSSLRIFLANSLSGIAGPQPLEKVAYPLNNRVVFFFRGGSCLLLCLL
jgi:hypothetical protein